MLGKKHKIGGMSGMNEMYREPRELEVDRQHKVWSKEDEYDPFTLEAVRGLEILDSDTTDISTVNDGVRSSESKQKVFLCHDGAKLVAAYAIAGA